MINQLTFCTDTVNVVIHGVTREVKTGGILQTTLEQDVIQEAIDGLPEDLQIELGKFIDLGYPVVFREVSSFKGDQFEGQFLFWADNTCGLILGVVKGKLDPQTLKHELVHYDQFIRGDLAVTTSGEILWKGQLYPAPSGKANKEYFNTPWEQEAYTEQFQWAFEMGYDRKSVAERMRRCQMALAWQAFLRTWPGALAFMLVLMVVMWALPTGGFWWILQGLIGTFTFFQGVAVLSLTPFAKKWAEKAIEGNGKFALHFANIVQRVNAS